MPEQQLRLNQRASLTVAGGYADHRMRDGAGQLGVVLDTWGDRAVCRFDREALIASRSAADATLASSSIGGLVKVRVGAMLLLASLTELKADRDGEATILAEIEYIGEGPAGPDGNIASFRRGLSVYPHPGDAVTFATNEDLQRIFAPPDLPHIQLGTVYPTEDVRAPLLFDSLMGRHFAVVGSSGAGKSTTVALMLDRIIASASQGHVVILDPHGEYARAFGPLAQVWDVDNLQLPYWAMNLEEHCEAFIVSEGDSRTIDANIMAKCLLMARARNVHVRDSSKLTADTPVAYQLKDLADAFEQEAGRLQKLADAPRYTQMRLAIEQFFADRRFRFIFNPAHASNSIEQFLGEVLRIPGGGKPISIIDLAGVPTEIVNVVVSTISRLILDYAIWAPREERAPVLLVCEEAHRYLPRVKSHATRTVERQLERIAREGRKYGVCLGLVTQRPSELSETALSQCGTIISMRLNNLNDQAQLKASLTEGARAFVEVVGTLKNRECIVSGDGVPVPMRVLVDTLEEAKRPASADPVFSQRWRDGRAGAALLVETVRRWREER
jgi:DNA helicase HerA-like ATPase